MAHEVESMAYYGEVPWHGLGTPVQDVMTAAEALRRAGLEWTVGLQPIYAERPEGAGLVLAEAHRAVVRETDGRVLGVVGRGYRPLQNAEACDFIDLVVDSGEAKYETAGSLRGGRRIWFLARLPKDIMIGGEDAVRPYLLLMNAHDGWAPITVAATPIRVVCMNTLQAALRRTSRFWTMRHVGDLKGKLTEAREALDVSFRYFGDFERLGNTLLEVKVTDAEFDNFLQGLFPKALEREEAAAVTQKARDEVAAIYKHAPDLARYHGTAWAAWNAAVAYNDYRRPLRAEDKSSVRLERAWLDPAFKTVALKALGWAVGRSFSLDKDAPDLEEADGGLDLN